MYNFFNKIFLFIGSAFIFIIVFEIFCRLIGVPKISHHKLLAKSQLLIPKINSNTILFLGDSRVEWGIKPELIQDNYTSINNFKVLNLAMPGSNGLDILSYLKSENIFPKIIIMGYTPNYGRYTNHDLDRVNYTDINRIKENVKYYLRQNSFFYDYHSFIEYINGKHPLHLNHDYDDFGGVNISLYGNFLSKKEMEIKVYSEWSNDFSSKKFETYCNSVVELENWFSNGGTKMYGLIMPVSKELDDLERQVSKENKLLEMYDKWYDYSKLYQFDNKTDSLYFKDGSHLTLEHSKLFSEKLGNEINIDTN